MKEQSAVIDALMTIKDFSLSNQKIILSELNSLFVECSQDLYDNGIKFENAGLLEKLLFQIIFHNETLLKLTEGVNIGVRNKKLSFYDLTAVYSIARLQIETFINLSYIFFIDIEYSKEIRGSVYKIHGLRKQIELTKHHQKSFEPVQKMRNELALELFKIRKLDDFKNMSKGNRKKIIHPSYARLIKLNEIYPLIKIGDLSKSHSLYSNHIHAEYISIRQLKSALDDKTQLENSFSNVILLCSRITSLTISNLNEQYELKKSSLSIAPLKLKKIIASINKLSAGL